MIFYNPIQGDAFTTQVDYRPKTCFLMTQLGQPVQQAIVDIRDRLSSFFTSHGIDVIDANSIITGKDFLMKIWGMIIGVPLGVAIIHHEMSPQTLSNIFYEVGVLQAYGKESLVIKTKETDVPSDFVRTEYLEFGDNFEGKLEKFIKHFLSQADYFAKMADQVENNPLLAIDYFRRAFLISGEESYKNNAKKIFDEASIEGRAKNSVEMLLVNF